MPVCVCVCVGGGGLCTGSAEHVMIPIAGARQRHDWHFLQVLTLLFGESRDNFSPTHVQLASNDVGFLVFFLICRLWTVKTGECLYTLPISSGVSLTHMDVAVDMSTIIVADANCAV